MHDPNMFTPATMHSGANLLQTALTGPSDEAGQAARQYAQQVQAWSDSAAAMKASAASGHFAVDPALGQALVDYFNRCLAKLPTMQRDIQNITREYKLGTTPGAKLVGPSNLVCAQQLETAFNQLKSVYTNARDAYAAAMKNYKDSEEEATFTMQQLMGTE